MSWADLARPRLLLVCVRARVHVCECARAWRVSVWGCVCCHSAFRVLPSRVLPALGFPAGGDRPRAVRKRVPRRLFVCLCADPCRPGHHFLLRSGQAHKRKGGCRPSPSSFPQMPSAAGVERRESEQGAGLLSVGLPGLKRGRVQAQDC
nr:uncharacterized protein LOC101425880 [Dasypus novemcinctus]